MDYNAPWSDSSRHSINIFSLFTVKPRSQVRPPGSLWTTRAARGPGRGGGQIDDPRLYLEFKIFKYRTQVRQRGAFELE